MGLKHIYSLLLVLFLALFFVSTPSYASPAEKAIEEEMAPQLKFLELHGYLRLRSDLFYNMDLGTYNPYSGSCSSRVLPPISARTDPSSGYVTPLRGNTLTGANMRLRVEPTLNISDEIRINAQIDILDNVSLGSTPDAFNGYNNVQNPYYPMPVYSQGAYAPHKGWNSIVDSIVVKRAWAEVTTPFGELRFGRMPSNWGLGVMINDGSCFDCDDGVSVDRITFIFKVFNHYIIPAYDFASDGPISTQVSNTGYPVETVAQGIDADQRDDVHQYVLIFARRDSPNEVRDLLDNDKPSINYGLYNALRTQSYDYPLYYTQGEYPSTAQDLAYRNLMVYVGSPWFRLFYKKFHLEFEADFIYGTLGDAMQTPDVMNGAADPQYQNIQIWQWGVVLQGDYKFLRDKLKVGFEFGMASGDRFPGWGAWPGYNTTPLGPAQYGTKDPYGNVVNDKAISNFRFSTDYRVDLILWREIVGTVTDAWYVKPSVYYMILDGFGAGLDIIYSQANFQESTPGNSRPLGLEFDLHVFYNSEDGFIAGVDYGVLVPFSGLDNIGALGIRDPSAVPGPNMLIQAGVAQRLRGYLGVRF